MPLIFKIPKLNDFLVASKTSRHKPDIGEVVRVPLAATYSGKGSHYATIGRRFSDDKIYVYHTEKVRDRWKGPAGKRRKSVEGHWKTRVFAIPADRVKTVTQGTRHFTIELAK